MKKLTVEELGAMSADELLAHRNDAYTRKLELGRLIMTRRRERERTHCDICARLAQSDVDTMSKELAGIGEYMAVIASILACKGVVTYRAGSALR